MAINNVPNKCPTQKNDNLKIGNFGLTFKIDKSLVSSSISTLSLQKSSACSGYLYSPQFIFIVDPVSGFSNFLLLIGYHHPKLAREMLTPELLQGK